MDPQNNMGQTLEQRIPKENVMNTEQARELIDEVIFTMTRNDIKEMTYAKRELIRDACAHINKLAGTTDEDIDDIKTVRYLLGLNGYSRFSKRNKTAKKHQSNDYQRCHYCENTRAVFQTGFFCDPCQKQPKNETNIEHTQCA